MTYAKSSGVRLAGIAACVPSHEVDNLKSGKDLYGDDIESLIKTTGVRYRRTCPENSVTSLDLCLRSAEALREKGISFENLGGVICVTQTPDNLLPNNATLAQQKLKLPTDTMAMDINLACSGYPYGLLSTSLLVKATGRPFLLLDGDTHSHFVSPEDKTTSLLFGDAGTATLLEPCEAEEDWHFEFDTDGSFREALIIPDGGYRNRANAESAQMKPQPDGGMRRAIDMKMDGMTVFNYVVRNVPKNMARLLQKTGRSTEEIDYLVLHQANSFMVRQVARKTGFKEKDKVPMSIHKYGNSSSTTIPLTIASELGASISGGEKRQILMAGFGAGLSIASALISVSDCICPGVVEYDQRG